MGHDTALEPLLWFSNVSVNIHKTLLHTCITMICAPTVSKQHDTVSTQVSRCKALYPRRGYSLLNICCLASGLGSDNHRAWNPASKYHYMAKYLSYECLQAIINDQSQSAAPTVQPAPTLMRATPPRSPPLGTAASGAAATAQISAADADSGGILTGVGALLQDTRALMAQLQTGGGQSSGGAFQISSPSQSGYHLDEDYISAVPTDSSAVEASVAANSEQQGASPLYTAARCDAWGHYLIWCMPISSSLHHSRNGTGVRDD